MSFGIKVGENPFIDACGEQVQCAYEDHRGSEDIVSGRYWSHLGDREVHIQTADVDMDFHVKSVGRIITVYRSDVGWWAYLRSYLGYENDEVYASLTLNGNRIVQIDIGEQFKSIESQRALRSVLIAHAALKLRQNHCTEPLQVKATRENYRWLKDFGFTLAKEYETIVFNGRTLIREDGTIKEAVERARRNSLSLDDLTERKDLVTRVQGLGMSVSQLLDAWLLVNFDPESEKTTSDQIDYPMELSSHGFECAIGSIFAHSVYFQAPTFFAIVVRVVVKIWHWLTRWGERIQAELETKQVPKKFLSDDFHKKPFTNVGIPTVHQIQETFEATGDLVKLLDFRKVKVLGEDDYLPKEFVLQCVDGRIATYVKRRNKDTYKEIGSLTLKGKEIAQIAVKKKYLSFLFAIEASMIAHACLQRELEGKEYALEIQATRENIDWYRHMGFRETESFQSAMRVGQAIHRQQEIKTVMGQIADGEMTLDAYTHSQDYIDLRKRIADEMSYTRYDQIPTPDVVIEYERFTERHPQEPSLKTIPLALTGDAMSNAIASVIDFETYFANLDVPSVAPPEPDPEADRMIRAILKESEQIEGAYAEEARRDMALRSSGSAWGERLWGASGLQGPM